MADYGTAATEDGGDATSSETLAAAASDPVKASTQHGRPRWWASLLVVSLYIACIGASAFLAFHWRRDIETGVLDLRLAIAGESAVTAMPAGDCNNER